MHTMQETNVALTVGQPRHLFMSEELVDESEMLLVQMDSEKTLESLVRSG